MVTTECHDDYYGILLGEFGKDGISDGGTLYSVQTAGVLLVCTE